MNTERSQRGRSPIKRKTVCTHLSEAAVSRVDELVETGLFVSRSHAFDEALRVFLAVRGISIEPEPTEAQR